MTENEKTVVLYGAEYCPFCHKARQLLESKKVDYQLIDVTNDNVGREAMKARAGGRHTVPQIFIANQHVGGCDELHALDAAGKLDAMLVDAGVRGA